MRPVPWGFLLGGAALFLLLAGMPGLAPWFARAFPGQTPPVYDRGSFLSLAVWHMALVLVAVGAATILAVAASVLVTRPKGAAWRPAVETVARGAQAFPPAAVLAVLVPAVGFGAWPTLLALFLYGLLPIVENTIAGLEGVPDGVREAARAMGMSPLAVLWRVELPLAARPILAGVRVSAAVALGTAALGSTVGALTLGTPVIEGLVASRPGYVLQGAVPLALMAVWLELLWGWVERLLPEAA